ncbi:MAG: transporter substrate-binding domain-containing protein [Pseudomonadota bacterium]|nr:transporter substrate-binding domain-containing protein [Pseudomonadota bacterium]
MKKVLILLTLISNVVLATSVSEANISSILASASTLTTSEHSLSKQENITEKYPLGSEKNPIKVAVPPAEPFSYEKNGEYTGMVIDYWEKIAEKNNWHFVYLSAPDSYNQAAVEVGKGTYDIAIGNYSSTLWRSNWVNFSRPYLLSYIAIVTSSTNNNIFTNIINVFTKSMLPILALVVFIFFIASSVFWYLEKKKHKYDVSDSLFSTSIAMLSGNVIDNPSTNLNRFIFICILIAGIILQAIVIATITEATLAIEKISDPYNNQFDLIGKKLLVEKGSSFREVLSKKGARPIEYPGNAEQTEAYFVDNKDNYGGYVTDHALAYITANKSKHLGIMLSSYNIQYDELVFFFNKRFPYAEKVNQGILELQDNEKCVEIFRPYLGNDSKLCIL